MNKEYKSSISFFNKKGCPYNLKWDSGYVHRCYECKYCYRTHFFKFQKIDYKNPNNYSYANPAILKKLLTANKFKAYIKAGKPIRMGSMIDPLIHYDATIQRTTLAGLKFFAQNKIPYVLITKTGFISGPMMSALNGGKKYGTVHFSVASLEESFRRRFEAKAPHPTQRLRAARTLNTHGIRTVIRAAPIAPGLNDSDVYDVIDRAKRFGIKRIITEPFRFSGKFRKDLESLGYKWNKNELRWEGSYWVFDDTLMEGIFKKIKDYCVSKDMEFSICGHASMNKKLGTTGADCCQTQRKKKVIK